MFTLPGFYFRTLTGYRQRSTCLSRHPATLSWSAYTPASRQQVGKRKGALLGFCCSLTCTVWRLCRHEVSAVVCRVLLSAGVGAFWFLRLAALFSLAGVILSKFHTNEAQFFNSVYKLFIEHPTGPSMGSGIGTPL